MDYAKGDAAATRKLKQFQYDFNLTQLITKTTRSTRNSNTMIDLIFTDMKYCTDHGVIDYNIRPSDHQPVFVIKKKARGKRSKISFSGRSYRNYSSDLFKL